MVVLLHQSFYFLVNSEMSVGAGPADVHPFHMGSSRRE